ncbi:MAG TPA: aminoglycoside phosphotransferase family protein [Gemmatimonadaceae bacterium]|nr:aminoglycoside phosphotransferase family protein [Gemmatimonadaceae bacterium]
MTPDWNAITAECRGIPVRSHLFIGEGWCSRSYLVNDQHVFRFPKRRGQWEELDREIKFLEFAADKLPLRVPRYEHIARTSDGAPFGYAVYRYLPGKAMTLDGLTERQRVAVAEELAGFLIALHNLHPGPELSQSLPHEDARLVAQQYLSDAEGKAVPELSTAETQTLHQLFESYIAVPNNFLFRPTVVHADFSADHILLKNGCVQGVLDFGDVSWGDPDYDFMYLFVEFGNTFVEEVARRYGHADLALLRQKVLYFGVADQIGTISDSDRALEGQVDESWRRLRTFLKRA